MFYRQWQLELRQLESLKDAAIGAKRRREIAGIERRQAVISNLLWLFKPLPKGDKTHAEYCREWRNTQREVVLLLADFRCPICMQQKLSSAQYVIDSKTDRFACRCCCNTGQTASLRDWLEALDPSVTQPLCLMKQESEKRNG